MSITGSKYNCIVPETSAVLIVIFFFVVIIPESALTVSSSAGKCFPLLFICLQLETSETVLMVSSSTLPALFCSEIFFVQLEDICSTSWEPPPAHAFISEKWAMQLLVRCLEIFPPENTVRKSQIIRLICNSDIGYHPSAWSQNSSRQIQGQVYDLWQRFQHSWKFRKTLQDILNDKTYKLMLTLGSLADPISLITGTILSSSSTVLSYANWKKNNWPYSQPRACSASKWGIHYLSHQRKQIWLLTS